MARLEEQGIPAVIQGELLFDSKDDKFSWVIFEPKHLMDIY